MLRAGCLSSKIGIVVVMSTALFWTAAVFAQVENLRITQVDPHNNLVEVTNVGPAFVTATSHPFCHRFNYFSAISVGTSFAAGESKVFTVSGLNSADSDLWLYKAPPFEVAGNIVHGVKYGPAPNVGRTGLASSAGLWPSATAFAPAPPVGMTLSWDGFGFAPADWFIDEVTPIGQPHTTVPDQVSSDLIFPAGMQTFENVPLGQEVFAIAGWPTVNTSGPGEFTVRVVNDVLGVIGPRPGSDSTRWLRVRDQDAGPAQNRFYSSVVTAPVQRNYAWTFYINLETAPTGVGERPRLTIQHPDGDFANAWGIEFTQTQALLLVTGIGGPASSAPLYDISGATGVGEWVRIDLRVDFASGEVSAAVNGGGEVSLPIALSASAAGDVMRFCYRGEGEGNVMTMLIDDVAISFSCDEDLTGDGEVNLADLLALLAAWGPCPGGGQPCDEDLDGSGTVDLADLLALLAAWGPCR